MTRRRRLLGAGLAALLAVLGALFSLHRLPRIGAVTAAAPAGAAALHYDPDLGPAPGLLTDLVRQGRVPADAIDDGLGRFVAPASLTPAQRQRAAAAVARRDRHRPTALWEKEQP